MEEIITVLVLRTCTRREAQGEDAGGARTTKLGGLSIAELFSSPFHILTKI